MDNVKLKIKIKTFASEIRHIRREYVKIRNYNCFAQRTGKDMSDRAGDIARSLYAHQKHLGPMSRISQLAYGFLRGRKYREIEPYVRVANDSPYVIGQEKRWNYPDWDEVFKEAQKFSGVEIRVLQQRFAQWKDEADLTKEGKKPVPVPRTKVPWDGTPSKSRRRAATAA